MKRLFLPLLSLLGLLIVGFVTTPAAALVGSATLVSTPNVGTGGNSLSGVSCVSETKCIAIGSYYNNRDYRQTHILEWNGSVWTAMGSPNTATNHFNDLQDIDCSSPTFCMAVGSYSPADDGQTLVLKWDGVTWSIVPSPNFSANNRLHSVSCVSTTMCVSVGISRWNSRVAMAMHWNGIAWSLVTVPNSSASLYSVSCATTSMCIAVGSIIGEAPSIMKWNGTQWSIVTESALDDSDYASLAAVSCFSETNCIAIGTNLLKTSALSDPRQLLVMTLNGSTWTREPAPGLNGTGSPDIYGMSCVSSNECVAVGVQGRENIVLTKSGEVWASFQTSSNRQDDRLKGVSCPTTTFCSAVGSSDGSLSKAYSLTPWSPAPPPSSSSPPDTTAPTTSSSSPPDTTAPAIGSHISTVIAPSGFVVKAKQTVKSSKITKLAGLVVPKGAKVALTVSSKYKKVCRKVGTTVRTIGKGACVVKVVVTTKTKMTTKIVTVKVT